MGKKTKNILLVLALVLSLTSINARAEVDKTSVRLLINTKNVIIDTPSIGRYRETINFEGFLLSQVEKARPKIFTEEKALVESKLEEIIVYDPKEIINDRLELKLIYDSTMVDYKSYVPESIIYTEAEKALNINNPSISLQAQSAMVMDANTKEVLFHKNGLDIVYPASTAKLLTALVALDWFDLDEEIEVGQEVRMIASDSSRAHLKKGQVLTLDTLLDALLLPSGNDAAYVIAAHVGRRSLNDEDSIPREEIIEFVRLMNLNARALGALNSEFKTPDGYDALGQYVTAHDMAIIGAEAFKNNIITETCKQSQANNRLVSGEYKTWKSTNPFIYPGGYWYNSCVKGGKTGTSTMAGRCLVTAIKKDNRDIIIVVMKSTSAGRWNDTSKLINAPIY